MLEENATFLIMPFIGLGDTQALGDSRRILSAHPQKGFPQPSRRLVSARLRVPEELLPPDARLCLLGAEWRPCPLFAA